MVRECGLPDDGNLLSTIPLTSFAGLSTALLPWLIGGGTLHLQHGFCPESFAAQCGLLDGGAVVVPGPALPALAETLKSAGTVIALWRSPERMCAAPALTNGIVNIACFRETGCIATRRDAKGAIRPLAGNADMRRTKAGTLALRVRADVRRLPASGEEPIRRRRGHHRHRLSLPTRCRARHARDHRRATRAGAGRRLCIEPYGSWQSVRAIRA